MRFIPSSLLVRKSLSAHSWLGIMVGGLMYLVCLSGTLAVFSEEFERWEQPYVDEFRDVDPQVADAAFNAALASDIRITPHMYLVLPTESV
ncbi:MAG: PepSY domain-containing protein, partial [Woeseiaceae bacterium]